MLKFLKRIVGKKEKELPKPEPVYTLADLPPSYRIELNGLNKYRWVEIYGKKSVMTSEEIPYLLSHEGLFDNLSDAVCSARERYKRRVQMDKRFDWKVVVGEITLGAKND